MLIPKMLTEHTHSLSKINFLLYILGCLKLDYFNKELLILKYSTCQLFIGLLCSMSSMKSGKGGDIDRQKSFLKLRN